MSRFFAVDYLLSFENILPHIIVTDNNMESFYLNYALNSEMRQLGEDDKFYLDVTAGCELGKFLRPERHKSGGGLSMYSYVRVKEVARNNIYTKIKKEDEHTYERVHYECTYSDELSLFSIEPFECLLFLSTSDGPAELGPANIALFDGLPPKLRYGPTFNKFLKEYEPRIDDLIGRY